MAVLTRTLRVGSVGKDVEAVKRAVYRFLHQGGPWDSFVRSAPAVRRTFGPFFRISVKSAQARLGLPQTGVVGPDTFRALRAARAFDLRADSLLDQYAAARKPAAPRLVKPRQGFESLDRSLWEAYSAGRRMGLADLGTYNPQSRLPGGGPSDHAVYPALAFDLGFAPATGYAHPTARAFFRQMMLRPEVGYVILGDRIWSRERASEGIRPYTSGGHESHVHVSGVRR